MRVLFGIMRVMLVRVVKCFFIMVLGVRLVYICIFSGIIGVPIFVFAGVISEAPSIATLLTRVLTFVLSIVGIVAILALGIAGVRYMLSVGNQGSIEIAKKHTSQVIIGIVIALSALIIVRQVAALL